MIRCFPALSRFARPQQLTATQSAALSLTAAFNSMKLYDFKGPPLRFNKLLIPESGEKALPDPVAAICQDLCHKNGIILEGLQYFFMPRGSRKITTALHNVIWLELEPICFMWACENKSALVK